MKYLEKPWGRDWDGTKVFPLLLDSVFVCVCVFVSFCVHPQWPSGVMLPGAPPDRETLPTWVLCWLLPLPAFAPGVRRWPGCRLERQRSLPTGVPAHGAPWAEHQDLELFFCFVLPFFFPNNCCEKTHRNPKGGVERVE